MQKIITADKTETFLNEEVGEAYHSYTGAVEEAMNKYALPCKIKELAKENGKIRILDVCSGMGYNSAVAIDVALKANRKCEIEVIGLENDSKIIEKIQEVNPPIKFFKHYKRLTPKNLSLEEGNVSINFILGDARQTIKKLKENHFDAVFFDPFSPQTTPEMWKTDFFKEVRRVMNKEAIFSTYTISQTAREQMAEAGLFYQDGPIPSRRGPGTIATKWIFLKELE